MGLSHALYRRSALAVRHRGSAKKPAASAPGLARLPKFMHAVYAGSHESVDQGLTADIFPERRWYREGLAVLSGGNPLPCASPLGLASVVFSPARRLAPSPRRRSRACDRPLSLWPTLAAGRLLPRADRCARLPRLSGPWRVRPRSWWPPPSRGGPGRGGAPFSPAIARGADGASFTPYGPAAILSARVRWFLKYWTIAAWDVRAQRRSRGIIDHGTVARR